MNKFTRTIAVVFFIVATLLPFVIVPVWLGGGWGWGMMGPGMMGWGFGPLAWIAVPPIWLVVPLIWLGLIALALLGLIWSARTLRGTIPYCPYCRTKALTGASYCWHCGKPLPPK